MSGQVIAEFLRDLWTTGELLIPQLSVDQILSALRSHSGIQQHPEVAPSEPAETLEGVLFGAERIWRNQLPQGLPSFRIEVAKQTAAVLFAFCRSISDARFTAKMVDAVLQKSDLKPPRDAADHYSADLVLNFLPQLTERSDRLGDDGLKGILEKLCLDWPLSAVGVRGFSIREFPAELRTGGLQQLFVDRVIATHDTRWLVDPGIRSAIESAIGPFQNLEPQLSRLLERDGNSLEAGSTKTGSENSGP